MVDPQLPADELPPIGPAPSDIDQMACEYVLAMRVEGSHHKMTRTIAAMHYYFGVYETELAIQRATESYHILTPKEQSDDDLEPGDLKPPTKWKDPRLSV